MRIIIAIVIFSVIILFHELGHFLLAKANGIEVVEFSLGMGPRLLSKDWRGTKYSLKLLPLGGSCMMLGEDEDESAPGAFNNASVPARMSVIAAGPVFNFIMAFVLSLIIVGLAGYTPSTVTAIEEDSSAVQAGLEVGDRVTKFEGYTIDIANDLYSYTAVMGIPTNTIHLTVERDGQKREIVYEPETTTSYLLGLNRANVEPEEPMEIGSLIKGLPLENAGLAAGDIITGINGVTVENNQDYDDYIAENPLTGETVTLTYTHHGEEHTVEIQPQKYTNAYLGFQYNLARQKGSIWDTLKYSVLEVKYWIRTTILSLRGLVSGQFGIQDLSGPVGVVDVIGDTYEASRSEGMMTVVVNMLYMAVLLTANLGVMNLLPIPALDGGRLLFLIVEAVIRKPLNRKIEGTVNFAGLMLLMLLMVVVMYNDIMKLF